MIEDLTQHGEIEEAGGKPLRLRARRQGRRRPATPPTTRRSSRRTRCCAACSAPASRSRSWVHEREGSRASSPSDAEQLLFEVAHEEQAGDFRRVDEILDDEVDRLEKLSTGDAELTGTPSGFRDIDAHHRRLPARQPDRHRRPPGDGQVSAFVANIAENVAVKQRAARSPSSRSRCPRSSSPSASSPAARGSPATGCARARSPRRTGRR